MAGADQTPIGSGFGMRSVPEEVLDGVDLTGRVAVVTGGYSGIGLETTRALAGVGATVVVPVRSPGKAAENLADVEGVVSTVEMDLDDLASVRRFAETFLDQHEQLDLLIANAGIMACPGGRVGPGWERQFGVNHLGHMALTLALLPAIRRAPSPRVVVLSSIAHRRGGIQWDDIHFTDTPYDKCRAYAQAKTANSLFAVALDHRLRDVGGRAFAVHPGGIFTPLQRDLPVEEQIQLGWLGPDGQPSEAAQRMFKTPAQGCTTTLWAATSPLLADRGGLYLEDCDVAPLATESSQPWEGVADHAVDESEAERLWTASETMLTSATP